MSGTRRCDLCGLMVPEVRWIQPVVGLPAAPDAKVDHPASGEGHPRYGSAGQQRGAGSQVGGGRWRTKMRTHAFRTIMYIATVGRAAAESGRLNATDKQDKSDAEENRIGVVIAAAMMILMMVILGAQKVRYRQPRCSDCGKPIEVHTEENPIAPDRPDRITITRKCGTRCRGCYTAPLCSQCYQIHRYACLSDSEESSPDGTQPATTSEEENTQQVEEDRAADDYQDGHRPQPSKRENTEQEEEDRAADDYQDGNRPQPPKRKRRRRQSTAEQADVKDAIEVAHTLEILNGQNQTADANVFAFVDYCIGVSTLRRAAQ